MRPAPKMLVVPKIRDTRAVTSRVDAAGFKATVLHLALLGLRGRSIDEAHLETLILAAKEIEDELNELAEEIHG